GVGGASEGGGQDGPGERAGIWVAENRGRDATAEQRLGLAHEVLIERVLAGDEDRQTMSPPAGATPLLAQAGHRPWKPDGDDRVEQPHVDAELESVRR